MRGVGVKETDVGDVWESELVSRRMRPLLDGEKSGEKLAMVAMTELIRETEQKETWLRVQERKSRKPPEAELELQRPRQLWKSIKKDGEGRELHLGRERMNWLRSRDRAVQEDRTAALVRKWRRETFPKVVMENGAQNGRQIKKRQVSGDQD